MAQSFAHCSFRENPLFNNEDKLISGRPTKDSDRCTPSPGEIRAFTPTVALVIALLAISGSANSSVVTYSEDNL